MENVTVLLWHIHTLTQCHPYFLNFAAGARPLPTLSLILQQECNPTMSRMFSHRLVSCWPLFCFFFFFHVLLFDQNRDLSNLQINTLAHPQSSHSGSAFSYFRNAIYPYSKCNSQLKMARTHRAGAKPGRFNHTGTLSLWYIRLIFDISVPRTIDINILLVLFCNNQVGQLWSPE